MLDSGHYKLHLATFILLPRSTAIGTTMDLPRNLLCILFFILVCTSHAAYSEQASSALLHWKSTLDSSSTSNLSSWSPANSTCVWFGILCSNASATTSHIIGLRLPEAGIKGRLETLNFAAFPQLTELNLSRNGLHGAIHLFAASAGVS